MDERFHLLDSYNFFSGIATQLADLVAVDSATVGRFKFGVAGQVGLSEIDAIPNRA